MRKDNNRLSTKGKEERKGKEKSVVVFFVPSKVFVYHGVFYTLKTL